LPASKAAITRANPGLQKDVAPLPFQNLKSESWESLIGGRLFTWAGGILLILSTAFFVVWSWRYLDLPAWSRVALLHSLGLGVIVLANWFKGRMLELHSQVLYGVGIFALYASGLAMTHLYKLGSPHEQFWGFLDGGLITALAIGLSLRNKSVGIILLGAFGGYLTPFVTLQGSDPVITFSYLAFLNIALILSAHFGKWSFLQELAWIVTALIFMPAIVNLPLGNFVQEFATPQQATALLSLHATIFLAAIALPSLLLRMPSTRSGNVVLACNSVAYIAAFAYLNFESWRQIAVLCFVLAGIHAALCYAALKRLPVNDRLARVNLALGSLLVTLGLTVWFYESPHLWTSIWAIEGVAFALIGFAFRDRQMLVTASLAFLLTLLKTLTAQGMFQNPIDNTAWWDPRTSPWLLMAGTLGIAGSGYWWMPRIPGIIVGKSWLGQVTMRSFSDAFLAIANLMLLIAMGIQFSDNPPVFLTLFAIDVGALWAIAFAFNVAGLRKYSTAIALPLAAFTCLFLLTQASNLPTQWNLNLRMAVLTVAALFLFSGWKHWEPNNSKLQPAEKSLHCLFTTLGHLLIIVFLTGETIYWFGQVSPDSAWGGLTLCVALWAIYSAGLTNLGWRSGYSLLAGLGLLVFISTAAFTLMRSVNGLRLHVASNWGLLPLFAYSLVAAILIGFGWIYWQRRKQLSNGVEKNAHFVLTTVGHFILLTTLACQIKYVMEPHGHTGSIITVCTCMAALYAGTLIKLGTKLRYQYTAQLGVFVLCIGSVVCIFQLLMTLQSDALMPWTSWRSICYGTVGGLSIGFGLFYWAEQANKTKSDNRGYHAILTILGHLTLLLMVSCLVQQFFATEIGTPSIAKEATFSVVWACYAALMVACGFWFRYPLPRFLGLGLFATVLVKVFLMDLAQFSLIVRVIALLILGLLLLGTSLLYQKFKSRIENVEPENSKAKGMD
ncbi:MAG: DUF2339 domain-containing protein, partial [Pirellulaceae bacterium]|nr:DUF2339 domain-containing protein [Pirellulaceae bacterium]